MILGEAIVDGQPTPKARARVTIRGGKPMAYTPRTTKKFEELIAWSWRGQRCYAGKVALFVDVREDMKQRAGDLDNYVKAASDAICNGLAALNDRQVERIEACIARKTANPGITVRLESIE